MTVSEVMDLPTICISFPKLTPNNINRDHILNGIELYLTEETDLLFIEGSDGIGKTTIMAQYALRHPLNTFSLFIRTTSRWAYDPEILLRDLANQICWSLHKKEISSDQEIDRSYLRNCFLALQRKAQTRKTPYIFIVDGIDEIPEDSIDIREQILDLLPFGFSGFKFILTGNFNDFHKKHFKKINSKTFPLIPFSLDEAKNFLFHVVDDKFINEIFKTCKGIPEYLTAIKRLIEGGTDIESLMNDLPDKLPGLFEIEWEKINLQNEKLVDALAILAHDQKTHYIQNLARILQISPDTISKDLLNIKFIVIQDDGEVDFVSDSFRKFANRRLQHLRKKIVDLLIDDLLKNSNSQEALMFLPGYFSEVERYDDLLNFMSPDYFTRIIEYCGTMSPLQQQATLGVDISKKAGRDVELLLFSIEKSIILGISRARAIISELEALIALDDYDKAFSLAQSAVLKEDLLQSLSVLAKKKLEKENKIDPELTEQIKNIYNQINPETLGQKGLEIASDLIYTVPDLAIELVEKSYNVNSNEPLLDLAATKISVAAVAAGHQSGIDIYEQIKQRINNPKMHNITTATSLILGNYDSNQVIEEAGKLENPLDGLFILRLWTTQMREREDAAKVIEYAIKLSIRTSEYTPNARDFRQLAAPLPYLKNKLILRGLITQFDALKGTLTKFGPSEDFVRLQLTLTQAEREVDIQASYNRLLEIFLYFINDLDDLSLKASCIARILVSLEDVDPKHELENQYQFHSLVLKDFTSAIDVLLSSTAEHYIVTAPVLKALAKRKPLLAFEITKKLNLEFRRNHALYDIMNFHIDQPFDKWEFDFLHTAFSYLTNSEFRDNALLNIFAKLVISSKQMATQLKKEVLPLVTLLDEIGTASIKCNALGLAYVFLAKIENSDYEKMKIMIRQKIYSSWEAIDNGWTKVDFGYRTAETLAPISITDGNYFYQETDILKQKFELSEDTVVEIYFICLKLTVRTFIGLLKRNIDSPEDLEQLQFAIDKLPSAGERIKVWADIASGFIINNRTDDARKIINEFIRPNLDSLLVKEKTYWSEILIYIAPVLFSTSPISSYEEFKKLKNLQKDEALSKICRFIFMKTLLSDPYDYSSRNGFDVTYDEILVILDLIKHIEYDSIIFGQIELLADSLTGYKGKNRITKEQRNEIGRQLINIIEDKLPDKRNIPHDGYKIAAISQVNRIIGSNNQSWIDLIESAKNIPNISDQVFVLGIIARSLPNKMLETKKSILLDANNLVIKIPALLDQIEKYEILARISIEIDSEISKNFLNLGIKAAITRDEPEAFSAQRSLIDLAYSTIGAEFAASLASLADDDPARKKAQKNIVERIQLQKTKQDIIDQKEISIKNNIREGNYPQVAIMLLSALNADRIRTFHFEEIRSNIEIASILPIQESYPIFAWITQNAVKRFSNTDQVRSTIKNMFSALMTATELSGRMAKCSSDQMRLAISQSIKENEDKSIIIRAGERDKFISTIKYWIENEVQEYIKISDPYFTLYDLELLLLVMNVKPNCKIFILTSKKQQEQENIRVPWEETYRSHWRLKLSDQYPPDCDIVIVGTEKTGEHPIHDRWWITSGSGFRMGTSYKSIGIDKETELSKLTKSESINREMEIDKFLIKRIREYNSKRLEYTLLSL